MLLERCPPTAGRHAKLLSRCRHWSHLARRRNYSASLMSSSSCQLQDAATSPTYPLPLPSPNFCISPSKSWPRPPSSLLGRPPELNCPPLPATPTQRQFGRRGPLPRCCCVLTCNQPPCNGGARTTTLLVPRLTLPANRSPPETVFQFEGTPANGTTCAPAKATSATHRNQLAPSSYYCCPYPTSSCGLACAQGGSPVPAPQALRQPCISPQNGQPNSGNTVLLETTYFQPICDGAFDDDFEFEVDSRHGCFRRSVPSMPMFIAVFFCILNCFLPGTGTFLASVTIVLGCKTEYGRRKWKRAFVICLFAAIIQSVTALFVLGWVWSVMWGINFIKHSSRERERTLFKSQAYNFDNNNHL